MNCLITNYIFNLSLISAWIPFSCPLHYIETIFIKMSKNLLLLQWENKLIILVVHNPCAFFIKIKCILLLKHSFSFSDSMILPSPASLPPCTKHFTGHWEAPYSSFSSSTALLSYIFCSFPNVLEFHRHIKLLIRQVSNRVGLCLKKKSQSIFLTPLVTE